MHARCVVVSRSEGPRAELSQDCYCHSYRFPGSTSHAMSALTDPSSKPAQPTVCKAAVNHICIAGHVCRCPPISARKHHKGCAIPFVLCAALVARRSPCGWQLQQWVWLAVICCSYSVAGCVVIAFSIVHSVVVECIILHQPR